MEESVCKCQTVFGHLVGAGLFFFMVVFGLNVVCWVNKKGLSKVRLLKSILRKSVKMNHLMIIQLWKTLRD